MQSQSLGKRAPERLDIPEVVTLAFAVEILLKALLAKENIIYSKARHDLLKLYSLLPEPHSGHIRTRVESEFDAFDQRLQSVATCFEDWRYVYEHETLTISNFHFLFKLAHVAAGYVGNIVGFPASAPFTLVRPTPAPEKRD